jgi:hypothetical protein
MNTLIVKTLAAAALTALAVSAYASDYCTDQPPAKWMSQQEIKAKLEREGYRVTRIEAEGSCYEIKAEDKAGRRVELKLNPVDGGLRKEEVRS